MNKEVNRKAENRGSKWAEPHGNRFTLSLSQKRAFLVFSLFFCAIPSVFGAKIATNVTDSAHFGPLFDQFPLTLKTGEGTEAAGPIFGHSRSGTASLFRFSPLFSLYQDSSIPQTEAELLYPVLTFDKFGSEYRFQIFQIFSFAGGEALQGGEKDRVSLFPIYFHQRSPIPGEDYTAVVPFYGRLKNRFFRDEIFFVMLPLYLQTEKRDVITDNYLFPIFHRRHGAGVEGWQFWPVVGQEEKAVTVSTNNWGDVVQSPGHEKFFALWPIYFNNTLGIGSTNVQEQFVFLPFYTSQVSPARESRSYGFPLGYTHTIDRERGYEEWDAPWPLVVFARGEGKHANRVWPFFSQARTPIQQSDFYMWPVYRYKRTTAPPLDRERTRILLFLYSDLVERDMTNNTALRRRDFWPLYTWRRDHENNERLQVLAPLEPLLPGNKSIERVYSPVWSVWRSEKNGTTGDESKSLLWNLYRYEKVGEVKRHRALFGLFQREKGPERTRWRIFFIPFSTGVKDGSDSETDAGGNTGR